MRAVPAILLITACASDPTPPPPSGAWPAASGTYAASYRVPTDNAGLVEAATYPLAEVHWIVSGDIATLEYDLPVGLVGGELEILLTGRIDPASDVVELSSAQGTGTCTASGAIVSCTEVFANLGALPISTTVVEQQAALEYNGPAAHRLELATLFASDPIGIADFDLSQPHAEDD